MWHCCCNFTTSGWQKLIPTQWRLPHGTCPPPPPPTHYITIFMGNRKYNSSLIKICKLSKTILTTLAPFQHGYRSSVLIVSASIVFKRLQTFSFFFTSSKNSYLVSISNLPFCLCCYTLVRSCQYFFYWPYPQTTVKQSGYVSVTVFFLTHIE